MAMNVLPLGRRWATSGARTFFSQTTSPLLLRSVTRLPLYSASRTRSPGSAWMSSGISTPENFQRTLLAASRLRTSLSSSMHDEGEALGPARGVERGEVASWPRLLPPRPPRRRGTCGARRRSSSASWGDLSPASRNRTSSASRHVARERLVHEVDQRRRPPPSGAGRPGPSAAARRTPGRGRRGACASRAVGRAAPPGRGRRRRPAAARRGRSRGP